MYEFEFQLKQKDLIKFQIAHILGDARTHILYITMILIAMTFITLYKIYAYMGFDNIYKGLHLISWSGATFWFLVFYTGVLFGVSILTIPFVLLKSDYFALAPVRIKVTENQLFIQNQFTQSCYFWHRKQKIVDRLGNVMIYISPNLPFLIPKRAFKSHQQRLEFVKFCKKLIAENSAN